MLLHSVVADHGVVAAAEQLVSGDAQLRFLRVVPRRSPFTSSLFADPATTGSPPRIVTAGDDLAATILDFSRELKVTLLALGEPSGERSGVDRARRTLDRLLHAGSTPVLFVPSGATGPRDRLRRILVVLHLPYPATDLARVTIPVARRTGAELTILALPSATPRVSDADASRVGRPALLVSPFDAGAWMERECVRGGCRARAAAGEGHPADAVLEQAAQLKADLVIAGSELADVRVGWRRRKLLDVLLPRLTCPVLLGRCA